MRLKEPLEQRYKPDFICYDKIIVEIKAVSQLTNDHRAQMHNYLKATGMRLGLLVNFGHYPQVEYDRMVRLPTVFVSFVCFVVTTPLAVSPCRARKN